MKKDKLMPLFSKRGLAKKQTGESRLDQFKQNKKVHTIDSGMLLSIKGGDNSGGGNSSGSNGGWGGGGIVSTN